jgi:hypothetical protein
MQRYKESSYAYMVGHDQYPIFVKVGNFLLLTSRYSTYKMKVLNVLMG